MRGFRTWLAAAALLATTGAVAAADLTIWWTKGTNPQEDEALKSVVSLWEKQTGKTAEVSFYATGDTEAKVVTALKAGSPPDLTFDFGYDLAYTPTWAYEGLLADVSDVIVPIQPQFQKGPFESAYLMNGKTGQRSYYAVPWVQMTPHVHYWKDLVEKAGFTEADVPKQWGAFFDFWCDKVQPALRAKGDRIYGIGQGASTSSNDPFFNVHLFLNAYGAQVVSPDGKLQIADPETRKKVIAALDSYVKPIQAKCSPPDSVSWNGVDDNVSFLNKKNVVVMNPTLSIPLSLQAKSPDVYRNDIRTVPWPDGPDGRPTPAMISVKQVLVFRDSPHIDNAKSFLKLLLKPENIGPMLKATGGRWMPVMPALIEDDFYMKTDDPHRAAMVRQFTQAQNVPFPQAYNRLYAKVMQEQLWQKAIGRIVIDGWTSDKAVDELTERMTKLFQG